MKTLLKFALFFAAVAAVVAYWELNHPFSYTSYHKWVGECEAAAAKDKAAGVIPAAARDCGVSYDAWMQLMLPAAPKRDPSTSEKHDKK